MDEIPDFKPLKPPTGPQKQRVIEADVLPPETPTYQVDAKIGVQIAENMDEGGYHPVIIFGSSNSGKSSLLGSLLAYFQVDTTQEVGISLGDPLIPTETEQGRAAFKQAEIFFYRSVQEFIGGEAHQSTKTPFPFFIPVVVRPKGKPEVKIAFMESNGEWYKPDRTSDRFFQALRSEIEGVLRHFQKRIIFIHVAPYTQSAVRDGDIDQSTERKELNDASLALVGALDSYTRFRTNIKSEDSHMFLVTKWDAHTNENDEIFEILGNPDLAEVEEFAKSKYTQGFAAFKGIRIGQSQKSIMQYCSGLMSGRAILKPTKELRPILYRYPQTMWNWIYSNATEGVELIARPAPPKVSIWQSAMRLLNKILS